LPDIRRKSSGTLWGTRAGERGRRKTDQKYFAAGGGESKGENQLRKRVATTLGEKLELGEEG